MVIRVPKSVGLAEGWTGKGTRKMVGNGNVSIETGC